MKTVAAVITVLTAVMALAFYDAFEDAYGTRICIAFSAFPAAALLIPNWIALELKQKIRNRISYTFYGAMILNGFVLAAYAFYAVNGPSDPDTAQHMRLLAFPIVLAVAGPVLMAPLLLIDLIKYKSQPADKIN